MKNLKPVTEWLTTEELDSLLYLLRFDWKKKKIKFTDLEKVSESYKTLIYSERLQEELKRENEIAFNIRAICKDSLGRLIKREKNIRRRMAAKASTEAQKKEILGYVRSLVSYEENE